LSDAQLVERFAARGDEAAFEALLHRHGAMVLGVCRRILHRAHDVEDAFQATFLVLARKAGSIRKSASVGSWLYGVAFRIAAKARGKAARRRRSEREVVHVSPPDLFAEVAWRELRMLVDEELSRMPEKCRVSFVLCCLEGKTHEQAAREAGWPTGSMSRWLARSRTLLRRRLARRGIVMSAAAILAAFGEQAARAALPAALVDATLRAALSGVGGSLTGSAISSGAAALAEAATKRMVTSRWMSAACAFLALGIVGLGLGLTVGGPAEVKTIAAKGSGPRKHTGQGDPKAQLHDAGPSLARIKALLLHRSGGNAQSEAAVVAGLHWLAQHQAKDGHWSLEGFEKDGHCQCKDHSSSYRNDIAGTAFGLLPMLGAGHTHKPSKANPFSKNIQAGLKYLTTKLDKKTGDFGGGMYAQGLATMTLCEAYALSRDALLKPSAQAAVDYLVKAQHQAGGWRYAPGQPGDTSVTGWQVQALLAAQASDLNVPAQALNRVAGYLDSCESATDHGYGYTPGAPSTASMTAVALLCRQYLQGWGAGEPRLERGTDHLVNRLPRTSKEMYFHFFAAKAIYLSGGEVWERWNEKMRDFLIREQDPGKANAHQKGSWSPRGDALAGAGGRLMATSLTLLTLEVYYRSDLSLAVVPAKALSQSDLEGIWKSLGEDNGMKARQAVWRLVRAPSEAVPFLKKQIRARPFASPKMLDQLIANLDSDRFAVRKKATAELERLGEAAEGALKKASRGTTSVEVVRRAKEILKKLERKEAGKRLHIERAFDAIELMGTPEARAVLADFAKGEEGAWLTEQAKRALQRIASVPDSTRKSN
jgi:RNA polymerase sigma factor (sigma-70 family)